MFNNYPLLRGISCLFIPPVMCCFLLVFSSYVQAAPLSATSMEETLTTAGWTPGTAHRIAESVAHATGRVVAVFDHDGTLMFGDVTEGEGAHQPGLIREMIAKGNLTPEGMKQIPDEARLDVWGYYEAFKERDAIKAYEWLPTLLAGQSLTALQEQGRTWYQNVYQRFLFPEMLALLRVFREAGVEIWIVSASVEDIVRPAASFTGIPAEHILGIRMKTDGDRILPALARPGSFAAGKVWCIEQFIRPDASTTLLTFGDSPRNDGPMLRFAARSGGVGVLLNPPAEACERFTKAGVLLFTIPSTQEFRDGKRK
ncbi:MAG: haloacid dehalogenase-like hydrolase [Candidatus Ozemobacteraceae bacterium]